jgi:hypothetical protein
VSRDVRQIVQCPVPSITLCAETTTTKNTVLVACKYVVSDLAQDTNKSKQTTIIGDICWCTIISNSNDDSSSAATVCPMVS